MGTTRPALVINLVWRTVALCTLALSVVFFSSVRAEAEAKSAIRHRPISSAQLPPPGSKMILSFDLSSIDGVIARERLFVVRDGKLLDASLLEGAVEGRDSLTHNAIINAPLIELKYWAVVTLADGEIITSPSFTLRRPCIPNIALSSIEDPGDTELQERLTRYIQQSHDLERDLSQYEQVIELLESLVGKMKEGA